MVWQSAFSSNRYGAVDFMAEFLIKTKRRKKKKTKKNQEKSAAIKLFLFWSCPAKSMVYVCVCTHIYTRYKNETDCSLF